MNKNLIITICALAVILIFIQIMQGCRLSSNSDNNTEVSAINGLFNKHSYEDLKGYWEYGENKNKWIYILPSSDDPTVGTMEYCLHRFDYEIKGNTFMVSTYGWGNYVTFEIPFKLKGNTLTLDLNETASFYDVRGKSKFYRRENK